MTKFWTLGNRPVCWIICSAPWTRNHNLKQVWFVLRLAHFAIRPWCSLNGHHKKVVRSGWSDGLTHFSTVTTYDRNGQVSIMLVSRRLGNEMAWVETEPRLASRWFQECAAAYKGFFFSPKISLRTNWEDQEVAHYRSGENSSNAYLFFLTSSQKNGHLFCNKSASDYQLQYSLIIITSFDSD